MSAEVILPNLPMLDLRIHKAVKQGIEDCTDDLLRVASLRTPVNQGTLEQSGTSKVSGSGYTVTGFVSFSARHKGFNYAQKMDTGIYNLGKKSKEKSGRGVRSRFSSASMKVGKGYLTGTAKSCKNGYQKHVTELVNTSISNTGFNR